MQSYDVLLSMEPNNIHIFSVNVAVPTYFMFFYCYAGKLPITNVIQKYKTLIKRY